MNTVIAIFLGIIIGFLGEWLIDFLYLRRKTRRLEEQVTDLEQEVTAAEGQLDIIAAENQRLKRAVLGIVDEGQELPAGEETPAGEVEEDVWLPDFVAEVEQELNQEVIELGDGNEEIPGEVVTSDEIVMDDLAPETGEIDYEQLQEMAEYDLAAGAEEPAEVPPEAPAGDDYAEFEEEVLEPAEDVEQPDSEPDAGVEQDSTGEET
jgi:hypothetical protein